MNDTGDKTSMSPGSMRRRIDGGERWSPREDPPAPPSTDVPLVPLAATVPPVAAYVVLRDCPQVLRLLEAKAQQFALAGQAGASRQCAAAAAHLRESARQFGVATRAVVERPSGQLRDGEIGREISSSEAGRILGVGRRQVGNLVDAGKLSGRRVGGALLVEEVSVLAEVDRRASA